MLTEHISSVLSHLENGLLYVTCMLHSHTIITCMLIRTCILISLKYIFSDRFMTCMLQQVIDASLASERSERAQSCSCSIEISDTYVYIYICVAVRQVICACSVVRNVGGVKCQPLSKA